MATTQQDTIELAKAVYQDAKQTWTSLTWDWMERELEAQLAGERPTGGPGMFLNRYLKKAGILE